MHLRRKCDVPAAPAWGPDHDWSVSEQPQLLAAAGPRRLMSEATIWDWSLRAVREPEPGLFRLCLTYQSTVSHLAGCGGRLVESWSDHFLPAARWLKFR